MSDRAERMTRRQESLRQRRKVISKRKLASKTLDTFDNDQWQSDEDDSKSSLKDKEDMEWSQGAEDNDDDDDEDDDEDDLNVMQILQRKSSGATRVGTGSAGNTHPPDASRNRLKRPLPRTPSTSVTSKSGPGPVKRAKLPFGSAQHRIVAARLQPGTLGSSSNATASAVKSKVKAQRGTPSPSGGSVIRAKIKGQIKPVHSQPLPTNSSSKKPSGETPSAELFSIPKRKKPAAPSSHIRPGKNRSVAAFRSNGSALMEDPLLHFQKEVVNWDLGEHIVREMKNSVSKLKRKKFKKMEDSRVQEEEQGEIVEEEEREEEEAEEEETIKVPDEFESYEHYFSIWRPLAIKEVQAQSVSSIVAEGTKCKPIFVSCNLLQRNSGGVGIPGLKTGGTFTDMFLQMRVQMVQNGGGSKQAASSSSSSKKKSESVSLSSIYSNDLVLLSDKADYFSFMNQSAGSEKLNTVPAAVLGITSGHHGSREGITVRVLLSKWNHCFPAEGTESSAKKSSSSTSTHTAPQHPRLYLYRINTLVTSVREFQALINCKNYPLLEAMLKAKYTPGINKLEHLGSHFLQWLHNHFNQSQKEAITAAATSNGFTLVKGPPGTGKTTTLKGLLNSLHLREYSRYYEAILAVAQKPNKETQREWTRLKNEKPHILVAAPSNIAVDNIVSKIMEEGFCDGQGRLYYPSIVRVGRGKTDAVKSVALDELIDRILEIPLADVEKRLAQLQAEIQMVENDSNILRHQFRAYVTWAKQQERDHHQALKVEQQQQQQQKLSVPHSIEPPPNPTKIHTPPPPPLPQQETGVLIDSQQCTTGKFSPLPDSPLPPLPPPSDSNSSSPPPPLGLMNEDGPSEGGLSPLPPSYISQRKDSWEPTPPSCSSEYMSATFSPLPPVPGPSVPVESMMDHNCPSPSLPPPMDLPSPIVNQLSEVGSPPLPPTSPPTPTSPPPPLPTSPPPPPPPPSTSPSLSQYPSQCPSARAQTPPPLKKVEERSEYIAIAAKLNGCLERMQKLQLEYQRFHLVRDNYLRTQNTMNLKHQLEVSFINTAHIVFTTLSSAALPALDASDGFEVLVVDEAAQAVELSNLIPMRFGSKQCVLVGDPQQLSATVFSRTSAQSLYERSLFERLEKQGHPVHVLQIQYRSHPMISEFPRKYFYNNIVQDGPNVQSEEYNKPYHGLSPVFKPFVFFDLVCSKETVTSSFNVSRSNPTEAQLAVNLYLTLRNSCPPEAVASKVGVITPYSQQLDLLKRHFQSAIGPAYLQEVEISTVDGYQGREKDIIILSTVRADPKTGVGFLNDIRRMNVALTRAKFACFVIGQRDTLVSSKPWKAMIDHARMKDCLVEINDPTVNLLSFRVGNKAQKVSPRASPRASPQHRKGKNSRKHTNRKHNKNNNNHARGDHHIKDSQHIPESFQDPSKPPPRIVSYQRYQIQTRAEHPRSSNTVEGSIPQPNHEPHAEMQVQQHGRGDWLHGREGLSLGIDQQGPNGVLDGGSVEQFGNHAGAPRDDQLLGGRGSEGHLGGRFQGGRRGGGGGRWTAGRGRGRGRGRGGRGRGRGRGRGGGRTRGRGGRYGY